MTVLLKPRAPRLSDWIPGQLKVRGKARQQVAFSRVKPELRYIRKQHEIVPLAGAGDRLKGAIHDELVTLTNGPALQEGFDCCSAQQ